jgi:2-methylcitrate dehydratase PrpD
MADIAPVTRNLAQWVAAQAQAPLPQQVQQHMRRMILDHLGGVVASSVGPVSRAVGNHVRRQYGAGEITAIGHGAVTVLGAALLNGTNGHGIETDDGYTPGSFHPTSVVLPAVFAVAEERRLPVERVLTAAAIGMELGCRLAAAAHPATRRNGFHNTPIAGVFAAAAAAAVLMDLDEEAIANALGIAGSHSSGIFEFLGQSAEVKRFHPGKAARDGIASADLAAAGLTGPTTVLEGKDGYFAAYAGKEGEAWFADRVTDALGERWFVLDTYIKPYPCCRHLHGALDAVIALRKEHRFTANDVASVHVGTFAIAAGHGGTDTSTMMGAQLSVPYTVAVALRNGAVTLSDFADESRQDAELHRLMELVTLSVDEAADRDYPRSGRPAEVTITLADGRKLTHRVQYPYGESANPISNEDLESKVRLLAEPIIGANGADALIDAAWNFTDLAFLKDLDERVRQALPVA